MGLVWDHYPEGGGELLTALKLADHAEHDGSRIYPGIASLARFTKQSERTVQRHIQIMLASGWLEMVKEGGRGPASTTRYRMPIERIPVGASRVTNLHPYTETTHRPPTDLSTEPRVTPDADKGDIPDKKGDTAMSPEPSVKQPSKNRTPSDGAKAPSAIAECWQAYAQAMKGRYGVEPPTSARDNAHLKQIIARVGAEGALQLVRFYVAHNEPFYTTVNHSLSFLVRDCSPKLWTQMSKQSGGREAPAPTKAACSFEYEGGSTKNLNDYPIGDPLAIARRVVGEYGRMVASSRPKNVVVQIGPKAHRYAIAELDSGRRA